MTWSKTLLRTIEMNKAITRDFVDNTDMVYNKDICGSYYERKGKLHDDSISF